MLAKHPIAFPTTGSLLWPPATIAKRGIGSNMYPSIEVVLWNGLTATTAYMAPNAAAHTRLTMHGE